jgi:hypothetical protein
MLIILRLVAPAAGALGGVARARRGSVRLQKLGRFLPAYDAARALIGREWPHCGTG